ncbi:MAG: hypothetical protein KA354_09095 [Phycisphaerae bacterium]|nr:hypothetical protein [Phycisphaerae bacterium]
MHAIALGRAVFATLAVAALAQPVWATCTTITFEELRVGTSVSTQYTGVTFSGRWSGGAWSNPIIYDPKGGTSSETQCLSAKGDAQNEFSDEYLRLDFDKDQTEVTFTIGVRLGCAADDTVQVRWYDSSHVLRGTTNVPVNGTVTERCNVFVRVQRETGFRRIEIEAGAAGGCAARFELLDDLSFDLDTTPPVAEITSPTSLSCVCDGTTIFGSAYDPDGPILNWKLERKVLGAGSWIMIAQSTSEVVNGALATWSTTAGDGYCTLRLTVTNGCELETVWTTDIWLDKAFNTLELRSPTTGDILGGTVCADGTAWDHCGGSFTLEHRAAVAGSPAEPFDVLYPPWIITDPLGTWNTSAGTPDGNYQVRLVGTDNCGNTKQSAVITIAVDNTPPIAYISSPIACSAVSGNVPVYGTASDAHLAGWILSYTGGDAHGWVTIASGHAPVIDGLLGTWRTGGLRPCAYTLRLVVTDASVLNCNSALRNQTEYSVSTDLGIHGSFDYDHDGDVDLDDFGVFQRCFSGPAILAEPECRE